MEMKYKGGRGGSRRQVRSGEYRFGPDKTTKRGGAATFLGLHQMGVRQGG